MPIVIEELDSGVTRVRLSGRIDIAGAAEIDLPMSVVGGSRRAVVIDLTDVAFMASLGLRSLVMAGKAILSKGGRVVLLAPSPPVEDVIRSSGVDELLPVHATWEAAAASVSPG